MATISIIALCACLVLYNNGIDIPLMIPIILGFTLWGNVCVNIVKFIKIFAKKDDENE